jgi:uncharacterized protein YjiS (DUF1127 family)
MTDTAYSSHSGSSENSVLNVILAMARTVMDVARRWHHNYRSRRELALYSYQDRNDLSFAAELDAEIAKPFWRK